MSLFTFVNFSANAEQYEDFTYTQLEDGTIRLDAYNGSAASLEIPREINGKTVTAIGNYFCKSNSSATTSIILPDTITSIGYNAFYYTGYYKNSYNWSDGVLYIGCFLISADPNSIAADYQITDGTTVIADEGFYGCSDLKTVTVPKSVKAIGTDAFFNCGSLAEIKVDANNKNFCDVNGVLFNKKKTVLLCFPIGSKLTSFSLPTTLEVITYYAMSENSALKTIKIPASLKQLGLLTLNYFTELTEIKVDSGNKYYSSANGVLFNKNKTVIYRYPPKKSATSYSIPKGVKRLFAYAFCFNDSLKTVKIPSTVTAIDPDVFAACTALEEITIPSSVKDLPFDVFYDCKLLNKITLPNTITSIDYTAFYDTGYYKNEDNWTDGVLYIGNYLIKADKNTIAADYQIKAGTTVIADEAFRNCSNLKTVTLPESVKTIGEDAFRSCKNIEKITLPESVKTIGDYAFYSCSKLNEINIPTGVTSVGLDPLYNTAYFNDNNNWKDGSLYLNNCLLVANNLVPENYVVKEGTTVIASEAFHDGVKTITIPKSVKSIRELAFYFCSDTLTEINVDADNKYYSSENGVLFNKNKTVLIAYPAAKTATTYTVPHSVKSFADESVFYNSNNLTVKLSNNITSITSWDNVLYNYPTFNESVTLYVEKGSYAESFANRYDLEHKNWVSDEHKTVVKNKKSATCFAKGYSGDKVCSQCGYVVKKGKSVAKTKLSSSAFTVKGAKSKLTVKYKKVTSAKGYQIKYKIGKKTVTKTYSSAKAATKVFKKLKKGKYTVQFRAYTKKGSSKVYSNWVTKTVKVK